MHSKLSLSWSCKNCIDIGNDLNSIKRVLVSLQEEIKVLKATISSSNTSNLTTNPLLESQKIIQEISEREKRKSSVIINGCKEEKVTSNNEQLQLDIAQVSNILTNLGLNESEHTCVRLGKFDHMNANRCRPIKVFLSTHVNVSTVISKFLNNKSYPIFNGISISRDRTPMHIAFYKTM